MHSIISKEELATRIHRINVKAEHIARKARPGQFVIVRLDERGERIPLTVAEKDTERGTIELIFQEVGLTTKRLARLSPGDKLSDVLGPLGNPTEIREYGQVICVGAGVGIAEIYPVSKALKEAKNLVTGIIGVRTKKLLILEEEMKSVCDELYITTDDGTYGEKGLVSDILKRLLETNYKLQTIPNATIQKGYASGSRGDTKIFTTFGANYKLIYCIGPVLMMKAVCEASRPYQIKTIVSLNPVMVDGTGMCGSCRVSVKGEMKFACVDGPEFDGHLVDFQELEARLRLFSEKENLVKD